MNSFFRQSVIYGIGQLAVQLVGFLIYPILTNDSYFTVEQFGIWNILAPSMTVLTVIYSGGLSTGFFKYFINSDSPEQRYSAFNRSILIIISLGVVISLIGFSVLAFLKAELIDLTISWRFIGLVMITAFMNSITAVCLAVYRALAKARQFVVINSIRFVLMSILVVYMVMLNHAGLTGLLTAYAVSATIVAGVLFLYTQAEFEKSPILPGLTQRIVRFSFPLVPTQLAGWVLSVSDKFLIGLLLGVSEVGLYSAGYQIAMVTNAFFIGPFSLAWGPYMFREGVKPDGPQRIADLLIFYTMMGIMFVTPLILFGAELIALLTNNPSYNESYQVIAPVVSGYLFFGYYLFYTTGFNLNNRTRYFPLITGAVGVFNLGLNLILLPRFGYRAAAWVTLVSYFVLFIVMKLTTNRIYPIPVKWYKIIRFWLILIAVILLAQVSYRGDKFIAIGVKLLVNFAVWAIVLHLGNIRITKIFQELNERFRK